MLNPKTGKKWPRATQKMLSGLMDTAQSEALVGLAFDHAMARPVSDYISAERVLEHLDRALDERVVERFVQTHLTDAIARAYAQAQTRDDTIGDWITAEMQAELRALAAKPVHLSRDFLERMTKQGAMEHMLRSIVDETLNRFIKTVKPSGLGGSGHGAFGFAAKALGNIANQLEQQLGRAARRFADGSMTALLERMVAILSSPDTARHLGRANVAAFDGVLKTKTASTIKPLVDLDLSGLLEALPGLVAHNLSRPEIRQGILDEAERALEIDGARPVRDLLADDDAVASLRANTMKVAAPIVRSFASDDTFKGWLAEVL